MYLQEIDVARYEEEMPVLFELLGKIWTNPASLENVQHSVERWGTAKNETGAYFYIIQDGKPIGITGYYVPSLALGDFGLRHHGVIQKGTGKEALDLLCEYLHQKYGTQFKRLIELIPPGRDDLIAIFQKWGFILSNDPIPNWEPKRDYYQHMMIREEST